MYQIPLFSDDMDVKFPWVVWSVGVKIQEDIGRSLGKR